MTAPPAAPGRARRGLALVCLAGVMWGTIGTAVQLVHDRSGLSPLTMGAYRAVVAVVVLLLATLATGRLDACRRLLSTHGRAAVLVGVLTASFQLLFFLAVLATGVGVATVVCLGSAPVLLLAVDAVRERRPPSAGRAWTVGTAVTGLLLVSLSGAGSEGSAHGTAGILLALGSGAAYALSAEAAGPLSRQHDSLATTTVTMGVAAVVLVPIGTVPVVLVGGTAWTWDGGSWLLLAHLGIVTMALAYGMLFAGLRTTASGTAVVATLVEPVTALALAAVVLGEGLRATGVLGSVLVVAAIGSLGRRPAVEPPPQ